jgi:hypothetical protein
MFALAARRTSREDLIADDAGKCPNEPQRKAKYDSQMSMYEVGRSVRQADAAGSSAEGPALHIVTLINTITQLPYAR